jgi:putative transposase
MPTIREGGGASKDISAARCSRRGCRSGDIATANWEHTIRNETDFARHVDYIHYNPVKHGLVVRVCDWPHSSFHRYVRRELLPQDWAGDANEPPLRLWGTRKADL